MCEEASACAPGPLIRHVAISNQYPVDGNVKTPEDCVIELPRIPKLVGASTSSQFDVIGAASPAKPVVILHCEAAVNPPAGASSKAQTAPAPELVKTCPSFPVATATGLPDVS